MYILRTIKCLCDSPLFLKEIDRYILTCVFVLVDDVDGGEETDMDDFDRLRSIREQQRKEKQLNKLMARSISAQQVSIEHKKGNIFYKRISNKNHIIINKGSILCTQKNHFCTQFTDHV